MPHLATAASPWPVLLAVLMIEAGGGLSPSEQDRPRAASSTRARAPASEQAFLAS